MSVRTIIQIAPITPRIVRAAILAAVFFVAPAANAVTLYWDANSNLAGSGTWDVNTTQNWSTVNVAGPPDATWNPNDGTVDAVFGGNPGNGASGSGLGGPDGQVTVSGTVNVRSITIAATAGHYSLSGGTINITDPTNSILMNTNLRGTARTEIIASAISGTDITVVPNASGTINSFLTLGAPATGATNTFTGDLIFAGPSSATVGLSQININNPTALPPTATVRMRRNLSQLLFTGAGVAGTAPYTATFNNNIILNDNASGTLTSALGAANAGTEITLGGVISGNANLIFQVGNGGGFGMIILANHSTYTGNTTLSSQTGAVIRLGINDALPAGTTFTLNRGNAFDLAGFSQRLGAINNTAANVANITNTGGALSTLTIDGSVNGAYPGNIGTSSLSGSNTNIALVLAPTNTGRLRLTRTFGNDYSGGTTIGGGKLISESDPSASATGTGPVAVNNGGTLGGTGGVGDPSTGTITVNSGGHLAPGLATGNTIGTLAVLGNLSLGTGSRLDIDLGAPGTSDRVDLPSTALNVPGSAASIGVNLSDTAAAGNGTYRLLSFPAGQYMGSSNASQFFTSSLPSPNSLNGATIAYRLADDSDTNQDGNPAAATRVNMVVTGGPNSLVWTGLVDGSWNVGSPGSPFNFHNRSTSSGSAFSNNDNVTFDDTGLNTNSVTVVAGGVQPNIVTINNSTATYAFSGGDIKGSNVGGVGALLFSGTGAVTINNNYTSAGPIISNKSGAGTVAINGAITAATSLTVNGGAVTLAGANTYAGNNTVNAGSLTATGGAATFGTGNLTVNAGSAVISAGVVNAISDLATLTLLGGGTAGVADAGFISVASGINEQVAALILGTTPQAPGTYGAMGSGATNINDEYFSGLGIITVGLPGDYNNDGKVNAADYVLWRKNPGAFGGPGGYATWRSNFGAGGPGSGSSFGESAVPEPSAVFSLILISSILAAGRRAR